MAVNALDVFLYIRFADIFVGLTKKFIQVLNIEINNIVFHLLHVTVDVIEGLIGEVTLPLHRISVKGDARPSQCAQYAEDAIKYGITLLIPTA